MPTLLMEVPMNQNLKEVEAFLLQALKQEGRPVPPDVLIDKGQTGPQRFSPPAIRRAIWHLVSLGAICFTDDWSVSATGMV